ncbi:hypothetical protein DINM_020935 [Dirofilaria immitis]|nr:hypothetical protein [Dirofilaria immitis]
MQITDVSRYLDLFQSATLTEELVSVRRIVTMLHIGLNAIERVIQRRYSLFTASFYPNSNGHHQEKCGVVKEKATNAYLYMAYVVSMLVVGGMTYLLYEEMFSPGAPQRDGNDRTRVMFNVKGTRREGIATCEMEKNDGSWEWRFLIVSSADPVPEYVIEGSNGAQLSNVKPVPLEVFDFDIFDFNHTPFIF